MQVTLYSRPGCHLCDLLKAKLRWIAREHPLSLDEVDVSGDPGLEERYGHRIPVLTVDGIEIVEGAVSDEELRKKLGASR